MTSATSRRLTERQRAVMERIDRRVPIKVIATELGVSETRINQHIRALKDIYEAESLGELVECYRAQRRLQADPERPASAASHEPVTDASQPLSEAAYSKSQVPIGGLIAQTGSGNDPGELVMNDVMPIADQAPWLRPGEPRVVPRVLDGEYAVWFRLGAIIAIAFGFLAAVVLTVTAAMAISEALEGRATVRVNEQGFS
ncbi:hypothetical protein MACH05_25110 [Qipengyuania nanhaisediminis]